jgi:hypothetical protein
MCRRASAAEFAPSKHCPVALCLPTHRCGDNVVTKPTSCWLLLSQALSVRVLAPTHTNVTTTRLIMVVHLHTVTGSHLTFGVRRILDSVSLPHAGSACSWIKVP